MKMSEERKSWLRGVMKSTKELKKNKKKRWVAEASYLLFHTACQLCKRDKIGRFLPFIECSRSSTPLPTHPLRSLLLPCIISADITPWKDICRKREREREHMARCIIEQCQRLRLETASAATALLPAGGASKDRKVICHWHNGQTRCHYPPWVWTQFSAPSAAKGSGESEDGEREKKGGKDWMYAGALSLREIHRSAWWIVLSLTVNPQWK